LVERVTCGHDCADIDPNGFHLTILELRAARKRSLGGALPTASAFAMAIRANISGPRLSAAASRQDMAPVGLLRFLGRQGDHVFSGIAQGVQGFAIKPDRLIKSRGPTHEGDTQILK
jgi:hypothetical protein